MFNNMYRLSLKEPTHVFFFQEESVEYVPFEGLKPNTSSFWTVFFNCQNSLGFNKLFAESLSNNITIHLSLARFKIEAFETYDLYAARMIDLQARLECGEFNICQIILLYKFVGAATALINSDLLLAFDIEYHSFRRAFDTLGRYTIPREDWESKEFYRDCRIYLNTGMSFDQMLEIIQNCQKTTYAYENRYFNLPTHNYTIVHKTIYTSDEIDNLLLDVAIFTFFSSLGLLSWHLIS